MWHSWGDHLGSSNNAFPHICWRHTDGSAKGCHFLRNCLQVGQGPMDALNNCKWLDPKIFGKRKSRWKYFCRHGVLLHPHHNWFVSLAHTSIEVEKIKFSVQEFSRSGGTVSCCNSESYGGGEKGPLWIKWEKYKVINEKPKSSSIFPTYMFKRTFCLISDTFRLIWFILVK